MAHSSSVIWASWICDRRCVVAGSVNTVWAAKLSSSSTTVSAVNYCFPGTHLTVTLNLINRRRNRCIRDGVLDSSVVLNKV